MSSRENKGRELLIDRLGAQGDGIAFAGGRPVYVPYTLAGERVLVEGDSKRLRVSSILDASPARVEPFCKHFGTCGGCLLQHMEHDAYLAWKTEILASALQREGLDAAIEPIRHHGRAVRRRAVFSAIASGGKVTLGFAARASNTIIGLEECPILLPQLEAALPTIRDLVSAFIPQKEAKAKKGRRAEGSSKPQAIRANVLVAENGLDIAISRGRPADANDARIAATHPASDHFLRVSVDGEILLERQRPVLKIGKALVSPPPDSFVQAVGGAESDMAALVCGHLAGCRQVADLFCGFGTFALRLAENSLVAAYENDAPALAAMDRAWRETGGNLKTVTHERRDLYRRPVMAAELKKTEGLVFDPPRAGAEVQAGEIARSNVERVAAVSCNPATLARDLKILVDGGFKVQSVTPIDQFAYTPHLEAVALLTR